MIALAELNRRIADDLRQTAVSETERVALAQALGRVLAEDVCSKVDIPSADVSAMDGYAVCAASGLAAGTALKVIGESVAGRPFSGAIGNGECVRIMTGAVIPQGANSVVMQEHVSRSDEHITLERDVKAQANIRCRGEELSRDEVVLHSGHTVNAADILLLASVGRGEVAVKRRLHVALFSTGDELVPAGAEITADGQLYDSNRPMLHALLADLPVTVHDYGLIADDRTHIERTLQQAADECDVIITSGGVSVGGYDFLKDSVSALGKIHHYKVNMKPGKPFVYGRIAKAWYFGLPGNPVSGFVGFSQIIAPALWQLIGADAPPTLILSVPLTEDLHKRPGRQDFQRGLLSQHDGAWQVVPQGAQDSHRVYGLARANCFIVLDAEDGDKHAGDTVCVVPFPSRFAVGGDL